MKKILSTILIYIATIGIVGFLIPFANVSASNTTYTGLKLPFASGPWYYVANTHNVNPNDGRNAVDMGKPNGVEKSFAVLAMHDGKIQLSQYPNTGFLMIDHQDTYCSLYDHLQLGTYPKDENGITYQDGAIVKQGNQIAMSGDTGTNPKFIHLHVAVISKRGYTSCPTYNSAIDEIRMIFDQIGEAPMVTGSNRPIDYGKKVTSDVLLVHHDTLATKFIDSGVWNSAYGTTGDLFFTGDFDGNGFADLISATSRLNPTTHALDWYVMKSDGTKFIDAGLFMSSWGLADDKYFVGDFDHDGKDDIILATSRLNPTTHALNWYLMKSDGAKFLDAGLIMSSWGLADDKYFVGDFNHDGRDDIILATARPNPTTYALNWYAMTSNGTSFVDAGLVMSSWGLANDKYFVNDFNGDGNVDIILATSRPNPATNALAWYVMKSDGTKFLDIGQVMSSWGLVDDKYFIGDFDGNHKDDIILATSRLNPTTHALDWYVMKSDGTKFIDAGSVMSSWGLDSDVLLVNNYRKSENTNTINIDVLTGRIVSNAYTWWVMYADK